MATGFQSTAAPSIATAAHATEVSSATEAKFSLTEDPGRTALAAFMGVIAVLVFAYWNTLEEAAISWDQPNYSHGWIIPLGALFVAWMRRPNQMEIPWANQALVAGGVVGGALIYAGMNWSNSLLSGLGLASLCVAGLVVVLAQQPVESFSLRLTAVHWIGFCFLLASQLVRLVATKYDMNPLDYWSFLLAIAGAILMVGGWRFARWAGPAVIVLFFMFPIPSRLEQPVFKGLQHIASVGGEVALTIIGADVVREGARLVVNGVPLFVEEACSGLAMTTVLLAMIVGVVLAVKNPWWERIALLASAIPVAIFANIVRITCVSLVTAILTNNQVLEGEELSALLKQVDFITGITVMPLVAFGLLWLELKILSMLIVRDEPHVRSRGAAVTPAPQS